MDRTDAQFFHKGIHIGGQIVGRADTQTHDLSDISCIISCTLGEELNKLVAFVLILISFVTCKKLYIYILLK